MSGNPTIMETIARAIYAATHRVCCNGTTPDENDDAWRSYKIEAEAVLEAIEQSGHAIVPIEPTEAMCEAGRSEMCGALSFAKGRIARQRDGYVAMIQAGKVKP